MSTAGSRPKTRLQQRMAAFDAFEANQASSQHKLKALLQGLGLSGLGGALAVPLIAFPHLVPTDLAGVGLMMMVGVITGWLVLLAMAADDWLDGMGQWYWLCRISSGVLFAGVGLAGLYGIFITSDTWLQHMR